jgi:hypothetical protein
MKHFSSAPFYGRLGALPTNIILGWKGLPWANTLSLLPGFVNYVCKKFYNLDPGPIFESKPFTDPLQACQQILE